MEEDEGFKIIGYGEGAVETIASTMDLPTGMDNSNAEYLDNEQSETESIKSEIGLTMLDKCESGEEDDGPKVLGYYTIDMENDKDLA